MKKQILLEIERIHEIMGLNPVNQLLTEQPNLWKKLIDTGVDVWKNIRKVGNNYSSPTSFKVGVIDVAADTFRRIEKVLANQYASIDDLTNADAFVLGRIISSDASKVEPLYQGQFRKAMMELGVSEEDLIKQIESDAVNNFNGDLRQALRSTFTDDNGQINQSSEMLSGILFDKISSRIKSLKSGIFKPEIYPIEGAVRNFIKNNEPIIMKAFREIYFTWFDVFKKKDKDWIDNKILEIESKMQEKLSRTTSSGKPDPQAAYREIRELFNFIAARKLNAGDDIKQLIKLHIDDNQKIPKELKEKLHSYGYVKAIEKRFTRDIAETVNDQLIESIKRNVESLPIIGGPLRSIALLAHLGDKYNFLGNLMKESWQATQRGLLTVLYKSPFTPSEMLARSLARGRTATIVEKILLYTFYHNYAIPFALQSIEGWITNTEIQRLKLIIETVREACDAQFIVPCPEEDLLKLENYTVEQFDKGLREKQPYLDLISSIDDLDLLGILSSFTGADEFYEFLTKMWKVSIFGDQKVLDVYMDELKEANKKIGDTLRGMGVDPDKKEEIEKLKKLLDKTYKNSLTDFENSFKDAGISITEGECKDLGGGKYSYGNDTYTFKLTKPGIGEGYFEMNAE